MVSTNNNPSEETPTHTHRYNNTRVQRKRIGEKEIKFMGTVERMK